MEEEEEWRRHSKWKKIFERKKRIGGKDVHVTRKNWFAAWSPSFRPLSTEFRDWVLELEELDRQVQVFLDEELWEIEQQELDRDRDEHEDRDEDEDRDRELIEQAERLSRVEPAKRFLCGLVSLSGPDLPDEDCPICLLSLSDEQSIALPCRLPHCFHRDCIGQFFEKALFQCPICRVDHSDTIDLFR